MEIDRYKKYEPIFGSWHIRKLIGEGSFGKVFEIERTELGITYKAALKIISIPQSKSEIKGIMADGMSQEDITAYYESLVGKIINEFQLMAQLKGNSNIVNYEDHKLIQHDDGIGWDILIKMELLTPIFDYMQNREMTRHNIIKMGIDLCKSLELCQKYNIIHRDVKPENIFISSVGDFKLGDFGVARTAEKTMSGMSKKGTYVYMAPEVYSGKDYNSTVDIYSLGLVMYWMLNNNRAPFFPKYPAPISYDDREKALIRRMGGEDIPKPENAEGKLADVVLKACSFESKDRYHSAAQMRADLEEILYRENGGESPTEVREETVIIEKSQEVEKTAVLKRTANRPNSKARSNVKTRPREKTKNRKNLKIALGVVATLLISAILIVVFVLSGVKDITGLENPSQIYIGETLKPEYNTEPNNKKKDQIEFDVSDSDVISVNDHGEITAKKLGSTDMTMKVGGYTEVVKIIVKPKITNIKNVSDEIEIIEGEKITLSPVLEPEKFSDCEIEYSIEDNSIAEISKNGEITAKKPGETKLNIYSGGFNLTSKIIVNEYVAPVRYSKPATQKKSKPANPFSDIRIE